MNEPLRPGLDEYAKTLDLSTEEVMALLEGALAESTSEEPKN